MARGSNPNSLSNLRPFQAGQSGNPKGRPRSVVKIAELAREHTEEAISTLASIMRDRDAPPSARVSAASVLLDRGWGKAPQEVTISDGIDVTTLSDTELDQRIVTELRQFLTVVDAGSAEEEEEAEPVN